MDNSQNPVARKQGLVVQEMPEEVLIYDLDSDKAHCLNKTAAFVWMSCDGKNSTKDIAKLFETDSGTLVSEDLVWLALEQLNKKNLLNKDISAKFSLQNRREVIKKIGMASMVALPIVASLAAPTSIMAATSCNCPGGTGDCAAQPACGATCNGVGRCV